MRFYANFSWTEVVSVRGHRCWEICWWKQWKPCFFCRTFRRKPEFLMIFTKKTGYFGTVLFSFYSLLPLILIQGSKSLPMRMVDGVAAPVIEVPCHWGKMGEIREIHKWSWNGHEKMENMIIWWEYVGIRGSKSFWPRKWHHEMYETW